MLCYDSWIDISWDGLAKRQRRENLRVAFHKKSARLQKFSQACDSVAQEIYQQYPNLVLALSGGCDSENIANVLHRNGIPFTPLVLIYDNVQHQDQIQESRFALNWCQQHRVTPWIVHSQDFMGSTHEKQLMLDIKPRLFYGMLTTALLVRCAAQIDAKLITGYQLEYYPDHEQMTYLEPQLGNYVGFVMEESDLYLETMQANYHPWAFYYWNPEILAAFVNEWDTGLTMQENKAKIYQIPHRYKLGYPNDLLPRNKLAFRKMLASQFGTVDCALLGTKQQLLEKLVK